MSSPLVTVATPVHNDEEHLGECVESIIRQTYDNWEYVIIDNCSTDRTPEIARQYAQSDSRIRYERHDEFVGSNPSHNRCFRVLGPESVYCKVVGADDWLYPECLSRMVELAESHPNVAVVGSYRLADTRGVDLVGLPYWQPTEQGRKIVGRSLRGELSVLGSPTALLLRTALVRQRDPFYDETFRHADTEAAYWALMRSDFGAVAQVLTFTREPLSGAETPVSDRLLSNTIERIRLLIRYGPDTMPVEVYRAELRRRLTSYVWMHLKQSTRRSRRSDAEFRAFHLQGIERVVAESGDDPQVRRALGVVRTLVR